MTAEKKAEPTKGSWRKEVDHIVSHDADGKCLNGHESIAKVYGPDWEANARLIASAPELLAACRDLYQRLDDMYDVDEDPARKREFPYSGAGADMQMLERVIKKAEGQ